MIGNISFPAADCCFMLLTMTFCWMSCVLCSFYLVFSFFRTCFLCTNAMFVSCYKWACVNNNLTLHWLVDQSMRQSIEFQVIFWSDQELLARNLESFVIFLLLNLPQIQQLNPRFVISYTKKNNHKLLNTQIQFMVSYFFNREHKVDSL